MLAEYDAAVAAGRITPRPAAPEPPANTDHGPTDEHDERVRAEDPALPVPVSDPALPVRVPNPVLVPF